MHYFPYIYKRSAYTKNGTLQKMIPDVVVKVYSIFIAANLVCSVKQPKSTWRRRGYVHFLMGHVRRGDMESD